MVDPAGHKWVSALIVRPSIRSCLSTTSLIVLAACGDSSSPAGPTGPTGSTPAVVASVELTPGSSTLSALGATQQFSATAKAADGSTISGKTFTWMSTNDSVVTVSASGLATAIANGSATVRATTDGITGAASLTVSQQVASVTVTLTRDTITALGSTSQFTATARDANDSTVAGKTATWISSDTSVATVNSDGLATAKANGSTTISATTDSITGAEALTVAQRGAVVEVTLTKGTLTALGDTTLGIAMANDANGNPVPNAVTWSSSDVAVASVDQQGVVTAVANGGVTIAASVDDVSGSVVLAVNQVASQMVITAQPGGALAGQAFTTQPVVELRDTRNNLVVNDTATAVTAVIASGGGTLEGTATVTAASGRITYTNLTLRGTVGGRTLSFTATGVASATSDTVTLAPGAPSALTITTQPGGATAGQPFTTQPIMEVRDLDGNLVSSDDATEVTATIASGGGTLQGSATATAVAGVATYTDLGVGGTVGNRTMSFAATGLTAATSDTLALASGPASQISLSGGDNQTALAATTLTTAFAVEVADAFANGVANVDVGWSVTTGSGTLSAATSTTDADGVASVTYTLGGSAATETVAASVTNLTGSPIAFTATATPNGTISGVVSVSSALLAPPPLAAFLAPTVPAATFVRPPAVKSNGPSRLGQPLQATQTTVSLPATPEYVADELIVTFKSAALSAPLVGSMAMASPVTAQAVSMSMRAALSPHSNSSLLQVAGVSPAILAARIQVADPSELSAVTQQLLADPNIATVERNPIVRRETTARARRFGSATLPDDPLYPWQAWHYSMIDLPEAWSITTGDASVLVAVVDDGIRTDHTGIAANLASDGYDFVSNTYSVSVCGLGSFGNSGDGDGYDSDPTNPFDGTFNAGSGCYDAKASGNHGLHVAGTIGAVGNNADGGSGVNWNVQIRPVRVFDIAGSATNYNVAQGLLYAAGLPADDGASGTVTAPSAARIINMSLGGPTPSTDLENAVIAASNAGSLIIVSAGNDGNNVPNYPAAYSQTLSVSAVGPDAAIASYSSFGSTVDIAAPGGDVADGNSTFGVYATAWNFVSGTQIWDGGAGGWQGTSMAAPHVSGVAALLLANDPTLTAATLKARLIDYAVDAGTPGRDDSYGWGILNARNSLTQSLAPAQQLYVRLINASSGAIVDTKTAGSDGSYAFNELPDGDYYVYAGQDEGSDQVIGKPGRRWGAQGTSATPSTVTVAGAGVYPATFTIGFPVETESNDNTSTANMLPVGGYLRASSSAINLGDPDAFRVLISVDGTYTFETSAVDGACGFALGEDTLMALYDEDVVLLADNDDIDLAGLDLCSRITHTLTAGTHYVVVWGYNAQSYKVEARAGN